MEPVLVPPTVRVGEARLGPQDVQTTLRQQEGQAEGGPRVVRNVTSAKAPGTEVPGYAEGFRTELVREELQRKGRVLATESRVRSQPGLGTLGCAGLAGCRQEAGSPTHPWPAGSP